MIKKRKKEPSLKIYDNFGNIYKAKHVRRPRFKNHGGRSWTYDEKSLNDQSQFFYYDSYRGANFYFQHNSKWYAVSILGDYQTVGVGHTDILFTESPDSQRSDSDGEENH